MRHACKGMPGILWLGLASLLAAGCTEFRSVDGPLGTVYLGPPGTEPTHALVNVARGGAVGDVWRLRATVHADNVTKEVLVPDQEPTQPLEFPGSFVVRAEGHRGTLEVRVEALRQDQAVAGVSVGSVKLATNAQVRLEMALAACAEDQDCDDGVFCNGAETCVAGACEPGTAPCFSAVSCVTSICLAAERTCVMEPHSERCAEPDGGALECDVLLGCVPADRDGGLR